MMAGEETASVSGETETVLGHPRGLATLFFTEMWERFSYYGMRALLVIYLTQHFLMSDEKATALYGAYAALVYLMPVLGGYLADRFLGARKAVTIGAVLLVIGHFGMAFEGRGSVQEVTVGGVTYEIVDQGYGHSRQLFLEKDGALHPLALSDGGIDLAPGAGLGPRLEPGAYSLDVRKDTVSLGPLQLAYEQILFVSLAFIIMGVGFLKANISTAVGALYPPGDGRRDVGYTIFYMGINLGSLFATIACGYVGQTYGWSYGFGLAGFGMLLGLAQYLFGQKHLKGAGDPPRPLSAALEGYFWLLALLLVIPAALLVQQTDFMDRALPTTVAALFVGATIYAFIGFRGQDRWTLVAAVVLTVLSTVFWMLFEQAGSSLSLYAERSTDLTVAKAGTLWHGVVSVVLAGAAIAFLGGIGWVIAAFRRGAVDVVILLYALLLGGCFAAATTYAAWMGFAGHGFAFTAAMTQSFNPFFIVALGPVVAGLWVWLQKRGAEPSIPIKFACGLFFVAGGFFILVAGAGAADANYQVPLIFLILLYLFHSIGELFLMPVGLSMISKLSPARVVGFMMGVWFCALALANLLASLLARLAASDTVAGAAADPAEQLEAYADLFTRVGWWGVGAGVALLALTPLLKRWMGAVR